ncbi:MAG: ATP-binding protein [Candidatus Obscuribacterales bacterium]
MVRISLTAKVLSLVTAILVAEIFFVWSVADLESQAEREAARALRSQRITEDINLVLRIVYDVYGNITNLASSTYVLDESLYQEHLAEVRRLTDELKDLVKRDRNQRKLVSEATRNIELSLKTLGKLKDGPRDESLWSPEYRRERKRLWKEAREHAIFFRSEEFVKMSQDQKEIARQSPEKLAEYRRQMKVMLFGGLVVNILLSLVLALFLVRTITERIKIMSDNAVRLAGGRDLNPPLEGDDEIAGLDRTFHAMARSLSEAARKERAVLDNVKDMVCSIDEQGRFQAINPAVEQVLGLGPDDLLGAYFVDTVVQDDIPSLLAAIEAVKSGELSQPFEARLKHKDGRTPMTLWSVHWSQTEKSLFCVIHDITERMELERLKQDLVAMITHDLRTPLSSVMAFLEMLETGMLGELTENGENLSLVAERNSRRMLTLINDLLDVEKIKSGSMELSLKDIEVKPLMEQAVELFATARNGNRIEIEPCCFSVRADEGKIERVLQNLIANALKFSPAGGTVTLRARSQGERVEISVSDRGKGIPADSLPFVFERFQQAHKSETIVEVGSGLGLTICKAIVELHGGEIKVESTEGEGTTFSFTLPGIS